MEMMPEQAEEEVPQPQQAEQGKVPKARPSLTPLTPSALGQPAQRALNKIFGSKMIGSLKDFYEPKKKILGHDLGDGDASSRRVIFQGVRAPLIPTRLKPEVERTLIEAAIAGTRPPMLEPDAQLDFEDDDLEEESDVEEGEEGGSEPEDEDDDEEFLL